MTRAFPHRTRTRQRRRYSFYSSGAAAAATAVVYDGLADYLKHTGGPAAAADGTEILYVFRGKVPADDAAYTFYEIRNGSGVVLSVRRTATNTIEFKGWDITAATSVFSCVTTGTLLVADGDVALICSARGTHASVALVKSASTVVGTNTPGAASDIDMTADWFFGALNASSEFLDATLYSHFADAIYIDAEDAYFQAQFYNAGAMVALGADGSNPYGASPLVFHENAFDSHTTNSGTGGDADVGTTLEAGTDPSTSAAITNAFDLLLAAEAWWSADHSENTTDTGFDLWADRTGNGNDMTQATAGFQPTRLDTSGVISGEWVAGDMMENASVTNALRDIFNTGGTYIGVIRPDSDGGGNFGRIWDGLAASAIQFRTRNEAAGNLDISLAVIYSGGNLSVNFEDVSIANEHVVSVFYNRADGTDISNLMIAVDGDERTPSTPTPLEVITSPAGTPPAVAADLRLGNNGDGGAVTFDGGMHEKIFGSYTGAERARIYTHFANKYGVTLA